MGINAVAEGSNLDDNGDYRPGMKAIHELGSIKPSANGRVYKTGNSRMCPKNSDFLLGINRLSLALRHDLCTAKKSPPKNLRESEKRNKY